jgi:hypothetical protein
LPDRLGVQRPEPDRGVLGVGLQRAQHVAKQILAGRLGGAVRAGDQQPALPAGPSHMAHHHRSTSIGPVQVIQDEQHRRPAGQSREELRCRVQEPGPFLIRLQPGGRAEIWQQLRQPRRDAGQRGTCQAQISPQPLRTSRFAVPGNRLGEPEERRHPRALDTPADEHNGRASPRPAGELPQRMGLADPGLPCQQHHPAPPRGRLIQAGQQTRHLRRTPEVPGPPGRIA